MTRATRAPGCMFCDSAPIYDEAGARLPCSFELAQVDSVWGNLSAVQGQRLRAGNHPGSGLPLAADGVGKCGTCAHLRRKQFARTFLKCALGQDSNGPATDIKARWPACASWARTGSSQEAQSE